ncbi:phage tail fiber protein [Sodalis glossinidius str. 'morsitans']|uniref:Phage tail fiber protein n=1 Tax=Sodalis glossinidius (strain morsitans) TaxID=343509 RepID=Q2NUP3_SODGM|nr:phage tail fiber protein [Sodalis glossinidius str. 'morsitans']
MANLPETPQWEEGIYQIEVSDPVLGGPDGISNRQGKQLASRTLYLKQQVEKGGSELAKHIAAADPHTQYAPKASPTFTGTPTAPTPANSDNSKKLATTEFVAKALAALAGSAPETLDTLKELADALGNDPNFATTVLNKLAEKLAKDQHGADIPDPALFVKNLGLGDGSYVGRLIGSPKVFKSSGTYTPTKGTKYAIAEVQGAGGGGGNATGNTTTSAFGTSGGAGAYALSFFAITSGTASIVVGAGGVPSGNGGTSSFSGFNNTIIAAGGNGGTNNIGSGGMTSNVHARGSDGGTASGGTIINGKGGAGGASFILSGTPSSGIGGDSHFSGGAFGAGAQGGAGRNAILGAGGSGATVFMANTTYNGGSGGDGIVIIWEYA